MRKALPLAQVGIARLELKIEFPPRGLAGPASELDLHVYAVVAHVELPGDLPHEWERPRGPWT